YLDHRALHSFPTRRSSDLSRQMKLPHILFLLFLITLAACGRTEKEIKMEEQAKALEAKEQQLVLLEQQLKLKEEDLRKRERKVRSEEHTSELQSRENLVCR